MNQTRLPSCSACRAVLPSEFYNLEDFTPCPICGARLKAETFPALYKPIPVIAAQTLTEAGQSSCFYHSQKKATIPCDSCGRFLCALCDMDFNGMHVCPSCLETGQKKGKLKKLEKSRICYDKLSLALAVFPMLLFWTSFLGAPIALYVALRYRKEPCGIRKSNLCFTLAIILSSLQIVAWAVGITYLCLK